ncbi:MAG: carbamoyl phosphate synthase small subunit [Clostridiales bacterium]|jgi:carbamoyl-phosphate synthase small subunit|nr:carbamoyl phosphate synthase small subunit [Clostridiales bacterium]
MKRKAFLTLENGMVFEGTGFGAEGSAIGEVVFTTGMTGYLETLTDKSYYGQIVMQTFPLIGNYGLIPEDFESGGPQVRAYIVKECCEAPSNFRSSGGLDAFLRESGVVGLCGIDTRALTKIIREQGVMNGSITPDRESADMRAIRAYRVEGSVEAVSCRERILRASGAEPAAGGGKYRVALWDFGAKDSIAKELLARGCDVTQLPQSATAGEIRALAPDGVMLTNGPGDPRDDARIIRELADLMGGGPAGQAPSRADSGGAGQGGQSGSGGAQVPAGSGGAPAPAAPAASAAPAAQAGRIPVFGICLGHQLMALARGGDVMKLKYGHRGANQPARDLATGRVYITSQNHGYAVLAESLDPKIARPRFENANDLTCEGIDYLDCPAFSVQFHPEASAGPRDVAFLFDRFIDMMEVKRHAT